MTEVWQLTACGRIDLPHSNIESVEVGLGDQTREHFSIIRLRRRGKSGEEDALYQDEGFRDARVHCTKMRDSGNTGFTVPR